MDSIAYASIKYGSRRTRELLFRPPDPKFLLLSAIRRSSCDPRQAEMDRLKPYYRGTRLLVALCLLLILPAFLIPFTVSYLGFNGTLMLIILYLALVVIASIAGVFLEASLDAVFGMKHDMGTSFHGALKAFTGFAAAKPGEALRYMGAKLLVDTGAMTLISIFYMPAILTLIWLLSSVVHALEGGYDFAMSTAVFGLAAVAALALAAALASMLMSVPLSAFYGYYTEEAVRRMRIA